MPLTIEGLRAYQEKSPSKWVDKFGDLDLDNIPQEYMKMGSFPTFKADGTIITDVKGNPVMEQREYFDAIAYRQNLIATVRPKTPILPHLKGNEQAILGQAPQVAPDITPSAIDKPLS